MYTNVLRIRPLIIPGDGWCIVLPPEIDSSPLDPLLYCAAWTSGTLRGGDRQGCSQDFEIVVKLAKYFFAPHRNFLMLLLIFDFARGAKKPRILLIAPRVGYSSVALKVVKKAFCSPWR